MSDTVVFKNGAYMSKCGEYIVILEILLHPVLGHAVKAFGLGLEGEVVEKVIFEHDPALQDLAYLIHHSEYLGEL